ncbi:MAG: pyruvate ferredoxin oxidoreductase [Desulfobacterales bacterium]|nr:pyruvate ferredoxin oxidoreductase [Desulfobacterales bacterium]
METFNIYLAGVGGQGIGLLSEIILRAGDHAGRSVKGVDTHGLAQRGGMVKSQIRIGPNVHSPLIPEGAADLVLSLERHEALRAMNLALKDKGSLVYYKTVWQPLDVRLGRVAEVSENVIDNEARARGIRVYKVFDPGLVDARMQNIAMLAVIAGNNLVPGVGLDNYQQAMGDLMAGSMLSRNRALFESNLAG